jgi:hypothetical protein
MGFLQWQGLQRDGRFDQTLSKLALQLLFCPQLQGLFGTAHGSVLADQANNGFDLLGPERPPGRRIVELLHECVGKTPNTAEVFHYDF